MQPIQPLGVQPQPVSPGAERVGPQITVNAEKPAAPSEIVRPVAAPGKTTEVSARPPSIPKTTPDASPMGMIMETMVRSEKSSETSDSAQLVPPVPLRYLSALMLQTLSENAEKVDERA